MKNGYLTPIGFDAANKVMVAEGCGDLPVYQGEGQFISCWQLTDEQVQEIIDTKRIWLSIYATGQPPVSVRVDFPFLVAEEWPEDVTDQVPDKI